MGTDMVLGRARRTQTEADRRAVVPDGEGELRILRNRQSEHHPQALPGISAPRRAALSDALADRQERDHAMDDQPVGVEQPRLLYVEVDRIAVTRKGRPALGIGGREDDRLRRGPGRGRLLRRIGQRCSMMAQFAPPKPKLRFRAEEISASRLWVLGV